MNYDLSILIPAKNEEWLGKTVEDLLCHIQGNTEIIIVLDGFETDIPEIPTDPSITIITNMESRGQRAATNQAAALSRAKYLMKVDAHCAFDDGFDIKMLEAFKELGDDVVMAPAMRNLHVFNWICKNGHRRYQGPSGSCTQCGEKTDKEVVWIPKTNPTSTSYCFDSTPHFQYFNDYKKKQIGDYVESMSLQGSAFMITRDKYWEYKICDEAFGSWGSQGIEVACKAWLSGGRVIINKKTWYGHCFRTQGQDFGFPYQQDFQKVENAKKMAKDFFFNNKWNKQIRPLSWLVEKFAPVRGWSEEDMNEAHQKGEEFYQRSKDTTSPEKPLLEAPVASGEVSTDKNSFSYSESSHLIGCLYYTDNELPDPLATTVRNQILKVIGDRPLVSVSLKPLEGFGTNIVMSLERGKLTMHRQILRGLQELEKMGVEIVYFLEHDVLYGEGYTDFLPPDPNAFYYNSNLWRVRQEDGFSVKYDHKSLSQMCAYLSKLLPEYENRVNIMEEEDDGRHFTRGYECGTRSLRLGGFSDDKSSTWEAKIPNIDVRHSSNLSRSKWKPEEFKSLRSCRNWKETTVDKIEGWTDLREKIK